jgi:hypothetical protein
LTWASMVMELGKLDFCEMIDYWFGELKISFYI